MLMSNVHVNDDVVRVEDVDVGADGGVNGDLDENADVNIDVDVDVCVDVLGMVMVMGCGLRWRCRWRVARERTRAWARTRRTGKGTGAVYKEAPALLHTHCCAEPCSGGNQRIEQ